MRRIYRTCGRTLGAALVLIAFQAQGASASPLTIEGGGTNTWLTGDQDLGIHKFTSSATIECSTASFSAKSTEGATINELTISPSYSACTAFGFAGAHVKTNGCTYTFTTPESGVTGEVLWTTETFIHLPGGQVTHPHQVHILCPVGKKIEITPTTFGASVCTQSMAAQTPESGHVMGRNVGGSNPMAITLEATLRGISYTGTGGPCGSSGGNAEYKGNTKIKCYSNELHTKQTGCTFT